MEGLASRATDDLRTEAARYALLRRLAPSMRHHLVVNLQPIGMVYEVLDRRLRAPQPNLSEVHSSAQKINGLAKAALKSSLDTVTWLAPDEHATTTIADAVKECLALVASSFSFRGYTLRSDVSPVPGPIRLAAARNMLTGGLIYLSDTNPAPADIRIAAQAGAEGLAVTLSLHPGSGDPAFAAPPVYRPLDADDIEALADGERVQLAAEGQQVLRITFPWLGQAKG